MCIIRDANKEILWLWYNIIMKPTAGIYQIVNIMNGKHYIGSSVNIKQRWTSHRNRLKSGTHKNQHLLRAWRKYGEATFEFKVLFYCDPEMLIFYEQMCFDKFHPEYNIARYAEASARGHKPSEETRRKLSEAHKGKRLSEEHKRKLSEAAKGKHHTDAVKRKISEANKGRIVSEETCRKISEAKKGHKSPNYGKHLTEEHKRKISEAHRGMHHTNEVKRSLSESHRGKHLSAETRRKISEAEKGTKNHNYGKHPSEETRRKISEAQKRYWESKKAVIAMQEVFGE